MSIRLLLLLGLLTAAPAAARAADAPLEPAPHGVDESLPSACYTLEPPDSAWRVLDPAELRKLAPEALAGLAGPRGVKVVLHAGPDRHGDLEASLRAALDEQDLQQSSVAFVEEAELPGGRRALRGMVNGKRDGEWLRCHALVFREGPDLYRLVGWGRSETVPADGSTFEQASTGLRRHEGMTLDLLPRGGKRADADGAGWRVRDGVYRDGALGFELDPRGAWRVGLGDELGPLERFSHVGLVDEQHDALLSVTVERMHGSDPARHAEAHRRAALGEAFVSGELEVAAPGHRLVLRVATAPALPGTQDVTRQLAVGVLFEEDLCIQVLARYPAADAKAMARVLEQGLASLRVLGAEERAALAAEIADAPAPLDGVGKGWSLRGRTYTHFAQGLRWTAPGGFWEVQGAAAVEPGQEAVVARLHERRTGLRGAIVAAPPAGLDGEAWHAEQVQRLLAPHGDGLQIPRPVALGPTDGLVSVGALADGSGEVAVVATCVRERGGVTLVLHGPPAVVDGLSGLADAAVGSLEIAPDLLAPTEMAPGSYLDLRLGFSLTSPDPTWTFHEARIDRYGPAADPADGLVAGFEGEAGRGVFVAAAWTEALPGEDGATGPYVPTPLRSLAGLPERPADEDVRATLRGRPCRLLTWTEGARRIELALLWRGRTALAVCAVGAPDDADPRAWLAGFRLVD